MAKNSQANFHSFAAAGGMHRRRRKYARRARGYGMKFAEKIVIRCKGDDEFASSFASEFVGLNFY